MPRGRKDFAKEGKPFDSKRGKSAGVISGIVRRIKKDTFKAASLITDTRAPDEMVTASVEKFWKMRNVDRDSITPMMAEVTELYARAVYNDKEEPMSLSERIAVLERIYKLFGIAYDSNREHNASKRNESDEEKSFEINYIVDGVKQEPPLRIECEQVETTNGS